MEDKKKIKYDLSYFMLDGGGKTGREKRSGKSGTGQSGKRRARGSGKQQGKRGKKGNTGYGEPPENQEPGFEKYVNGLGKGMGEFFNKSENYSWSSEK